MSTVLLRPCGANPKNDFIETAPPGAKCDAAPGEAGGGCPHSAVVFSWVQGVCDRVRRGVSSVLTRALVRVAREEGMTCLSDADLVATLLGGGMQGRSVVMVASGLLEHCGGLEALSRLGPAAIAGQPGVGSVKAMRVVASLELGRRVVERSRRPREMMREPSEVAAWFSSRIGRLAHEEMWVLSLNGRNYMRGARRVAQGGLHGCSVAPRDILRLALADAAASIVLIHNHPSGDPSPSMEDLAMTKAVASAARVVGTPLVDHVIVTGEGSYVSLRELDVIKPT